MHNEYQLAEEAQRRGGVCRHCRSRSGHTSLCGLINGDFFVKPETEPAKHWDTFSEADKAYARSFGIII